jgi:sigma-E factor negative regulatory protein RseB
MHPSFSRLCLHLGAVLFLSSFAWLPSAQAETETDAWQLLQKAAVAGHVLNYKGIFVYNSHSHTKAIQIKHIYNGVGEYSRNVTLDVVPREVFSQGQDLVIYKPKKETVVIEKRQAKNLFPNVVPVKLERLKESYSLHAAETDQVSGRKARLLLLIPKDDLRYSYKFWVDNLYGLLLKYEMLNGKQEVLESVAFNELNLMQTLDLDWFQPQIDSKKRYEMEEALPVVPDSSVSHSWTMAELPLGFIKIDQMKIMAHHNSQPMTQVLFSDGLVAVSVFIEAVNEKVAPRIGYNAVGNTNAYMDVRKGHQITVVGDVPKATVIKIGEAVQFK